MEQSFIQSIPQLIARRYPLTRLDPGIEGKLPFSLDWYHAGGLGNICLISSTVRLGRSKYELAVLNPRELDMPIFLWERSSAGNRQSLRLDLLGTCSANWKGKPLASAMGRGFSQLKDSRPASRSYDALRLPVSISKRAGGVSQVAQLESASTAALQAWLDSGKTAKPSEDQFRADMSLVTGLMADKTPLSPVFRKGFGDEGTLGFYAHILYGVLIPDAQQ